MAISADPDSTPLLWRLLCVYTVCSALSVRIRICNKPSRHMTLHNVPSTLTQCPSGHMTFIQRCIDIDVTLYKRHVPASRHNFHDVTSTLIRSSISAVCPLGEIQKSLWGNDPRMGGYSVKISSRHMTLIQRRLDVDATS